MENQLLLFFNIGGAEIFIIVLVVIMFFGSKKIPELARGLGKGMRELKNATNDIQQEIKESTSGINKVKDAVDVEKQVKSAIQQNPDKATTPPKENTVNQQETTSNPQHTISRSSNLNSEN